MWSALNPNDMLGRVVQSAKTHTQAAIQAASQSELGTLAIQSTKSVIEKSAEPVGLCWISCMTCVAVQANSGTTRFCTAQ